MTWIYILLLMTQTSSQLHDIVFNQVDDSNYVIVNDSVMGGLSRSDLYKSKVSMVFKGYVSTENNGGFASFRMRWPDLEGKNPTRFKIKVKGDGKEYQLRLRPSTWFDGVAYVHKFKTNNQWQEITVSSNDFHPAFRGRKLRNRPDIDFADIQQFGILVTSKSDTEFQIEMKSIEILF